jgi:hypothetical protein
MDWDQVSADFEPDGALRDIYVLDATLADWQAVVDRLRTLNPRPKFCIGGEEVALPIDVTELFFRGPDDLCPSLHVPLGSATLNCHFFVDDEIEFDLDPREMGPSLLDPLIEFLKELGTVTAKPVVLTMENMPEAVIMRYDPAVAGVKWVGPAFDM